MDKDLPIEDDLQRYFDKEMNATEQQAFEKKLQTDPLLQQQLERLKLLSDSISYYGILNQVKEVRKLQEAEIKKAKATSETKVIRMNKTWRMAIIAAASIILIISLGITYTIYQLSSDKVFAENYVPYTINNTRSGQNQNTKVEEEYARGNFKNVISLSAQGSLTNQDELLEGISFMQLNQWQNAIAQFRKIVTENENSFKQDAEYYLALTYIKNNEYSNALPLLEKIKADPDHLYHNQISQKLIREVKLLQWKQ